MTAPEFRQRLMTTEEALDAWRERPNSRNAWDIVRAASQRERHVYILRGYDLWRVVGSPYEASSYYGTPWRVRAVRFNKRARDWNAREQYVECAHEMARGIAVCLGARR